MSAEVLNLTTLSYAMKTLYDESKVLKGVATNNPAYARVPKKTDFKGKNFQYAMMYAPGARSYTFTTAKSNARTPKGKDFIITRARDYSLGQLDTEALLSAEGEGALLDATKAQADACIMALNNSLGRCMFGDGSGKIGSVDTPSASTTLTLKNADDVTNFEVGQVVVFAADTASALRDSGATLQVAGVDRDAGTLTMSANVNSISRITDGDAIFTEGDYVSASDKNLVVGFDGWNVDYAGRATELAATFFNVVRSADAVRLGGHAYNTTTHPGLSTEEAIQLIASRIQRDGWSADTCYMGTDRFKDFANDLGAKVSFVKDTVELKSEKGKVIAKVGFDSIEIHAGGSIVKCFADRNCPENTLYVQRLDTWEFKSLGQCPRWIVPPGNAMVNESADTVEIRLALWGNLRCKACGANGRYDWL